MSDPRELLAEARGVSKSYDRGRIVVLRNVSLSVRAGELVPDERVAAPDEPSPGGPLVGADIYSQPAFAGADDLDAFGDVAGYDALRGERTAVCYLVRFGVD